MRIRREGEPEKADRNEDSAPHADDQTYFWWWVAIILDLLLAQEAVEYVGQLRGTSEIRLGRTY